ncbi:MAG: hypothetical protein BMS9Abin02_2081 [Anaerolineae bacterium]|nr:MAG: hypothetical protein BMS9Abin02_2081 [Anaerolineae bacterium]
MTISDEKNGEPTNEPDPNNKPGKSGGRILRNTTYFLLILFLIVATASIVIGAYFAVTTLRGVRSAADNVMNPVSELVRQLVVEATPVILPNPVVIVEEINDLARLETQSYSFQDVLQIERNQDVLWGAFGESLLFVAYGEVIAGVDLAKMEPQDLQVLSPTKVAVRLPEAEILIATLDNQRSYVADRDRGLLAGVDADLETKIRQEAESRMLEAALENGIIEGARDGAQAFIAQFLGELGFSEIEFSQSELPLVTPAIPELPKGFVTTPLPPVLVTPTP